MNFISYAQLAKDVERIIPQLPDDIGLVVGIPRSGLTVALMVAQRLKRPATSVDWPVSYNVAFSHKLRLREGGNRILLVDDSSRTGTSLNKARRTLAENLETKDVPVSTLVMYVTKPLYSRVDYCARVIGTPRAFQWNVLNHSILRKSCVDIDGVLCRDPVKEEYANPAKMLEFVRTVKPMATPDYKIKALVTWRPASLKTETVKWLRKHGIRYDKIYFRPGPYADKIGVANVIKGRWKANVYQKEKAWLFIESNNNLAQHIHRYAKKPVLTTDMWRLYK